MKQLTEIEEGNKPGNPTHLLIPIKDVEEYFGSVSDLFFKDMVNAKQISLNEDDINKMKPSTGGRGHISYNVQRRLQTSIKRLTKMKALTEILPDVFVLEVPVDAQDFIVDMCYLIFKIMNMDGWVTDDEIQEDAIRFLTTGKSKFSNLKQKSMWKTTGISLPDAKYEILGTITKDEISFDVSEFIDAENEPRNIPKRDYKIFPGGKKAAQKFNEDQWQQFSQKSFLSLLLKHGFDNYDKLVVLKKVK